MSLSKPINSSIKEYFKGIYTAAQERATKSFSELELTLPGLTHFDQFKIVADEDKRIDSLIENSAYPFYVHNDDDALLTQFANRTFLLNVDESKELAESIYLSKYHRILYSFLRELKNEITLFTYKQFVSGELSQYFGEFDSHYSTNEENYNQIKDWRAKQLVKIVSYESEMLIHQIQIACTANKNSLEYLLAEKEKAEFLLDTVELNGSLIKESIKKLSFLPGIDIDDFDNDLLAENLKIYRSQQLNWAAVNPHSLKNPLTKLKKGSLEVLSNEITIYFSIDKIASWIDDVINGIPIQQEYKVPNWNQLIASTRKSAQKEIKVLTESIERIAYEEAIPERDIKSFLNEQLDVYRQRFNKFEDKYFFYVLAENRKHLLKQMFITNAFFSDHVDRLLTSLHEAIIIQEVSWVIVQIHNDVFDTHKMDDTESYNHYTIMSLLNKMVLDKELYDSLHKPLEDFFTHFESYFLPIEIHFKNSREGLHNAFYKGIERLQSILNDSEPSKKILYLQSRLKELKHRELLLKQHEHEDGFGAGIDKYSEFLKDFLLIESDFINETKDLFVIPPLKLSPKLLLSDVPTFETICPDEKGSFVLLMLEELSLTKNGIAVLSQRRKGSLRGIVEALQDQNLLPALSLDMLCRIIAKRINLELNAKLDVSNTSEQYKVKAFKYIRANFKKL